MTLKARTGGMRFSPGFGIGRFAAAPTRHFMAHCPLGQTCFARTVLRVPWDLRCLVLGAEQSVPRVSLSLLSPGTTCTAGPYALSSPGVLSLAGPPPSKPYGGQANWSPTVPSCLPQGVWGLAPAQNLWFIPGDLAGS